MSDRAARIAIVDYGMGNIGSVCHALDWLGARHTVSNRAAELEAAAGIILPGVGAFDAAMRNLHALGLVQLLTEEVVARGKLFLGICLGMQLLAKDSLENGFTEGLGWIDGHVRAIEPSNGLRVPHVGWNAVSVCQSHPLFQRVGDEPYFYFDHTYHLQCGEDWIAGWCDYGERCVAAVQKDRIFGVQFHPEKSQRNGLKLLRNFLNAVYDPQP